MSLPKGCNVGARARSPAKPSELVYLNQKLVNELRTLTDAERVAFFDKLSGIWCLHCGRLQPDRGCQCTNDL